MKLKLLVISILAALSSITQAEEMAFQIESDSFAAIDTIVNIKDGRFLVAMADLKDSGLLLDKVPAVNGNVDLNELGTLKVDEANAILHFDPIASLLPNTDINVANSGFFMT